MTLPGHRRVARALRAGGPEVVEVSTEELPELKPARHWCGSRRSASITRRR